MTYTNDIHRQSLGTPANDGSGFLCLSFESSALGIGSFFARWDFPDGLLACLTVGLADDFINHWAASPKPESTEGVGMRGVLKG